MKLIEDYQLRRMYGELIDKYPELTVYDGLAILDFYGLIDSDLANKFGALLSSKGFEGRVGAVTWVKPKADKKSVAFGGNAN